MADISQEGNMTFVYPSQGAICSSNSPEMHLRVEKAPTL